MSPFKRMIRRVPYVRKCALEHALKIRKKQSEASWERTRSVLTAIGNMTIAWAGIELVLTHLILWHHQQDPSKVPKGGLPRMLAVQLKYVKDHVEKNPGINAEMARRLASLRGRIFVLNDFRVSVIHGTLHQRNKHSTDWHARSVKIEGAAWRVIQNKYSDTEIYTKVREISDLSHEWAPFVAGIIGLPHPANSK